MFDEKTAQSQHNTIRFEGSCSFAQESHRKQTRNAKGRVFYTRVFVPISSGRPPQRIHNGRPSTSTQTASRTKVSCKLDPVRLALKGSSKQHTRPHYIPNCTANLGIVTDPCSAIRISQIITNSLRTLPRLQSRCQSAMLTVCASFPMALRCTCLITENVYELLRRGFRLPFQFRSRPVTFGYLECTPCVGVPVASNRRSTFGPRTIPWWEGFLSALARSIDGVMTVGRASLSTKEILHTMSKSPCHIRVRAVFISNPHSVNFSDTKQYNMDASTATVFGASHAPEFP